MPFVSDAYLRYLEQQLQRAGAMGNYQDESLPPPAYTGPSPTTTGELPPGLGGPGSYPAMQRINDPSFQAGQTYQPQVPSTVASGGDPTIIPPPPIGPAEPPYVNPGAGTEAVSPEIWWSQDEEVPPPPPGAPPSNAQPPVEAPQYASGDRTPAGIELSAADRARMAMKNMGLPPPPTGYNPFGGLPPGFTESNRFGGGAPIFTPPGFSGPQWFPGGSIFGGNLSRTGWVAGGGNIGNLGGGGVVNFGNMPNAWALGMGLPIAMQKTGMTREQLLAAMNRNAALHAEAGGGHVAGGGQPTRGSGGHQTTS